MGPLRVLSVFLGLILVCFMFARSGASDLDSSYVTCGSLIKLMNTRHNVRLHSHDVKYGSGINTLSINFNILVNEALG